MRAFATLPLLLLLGCPGDRSANQAVDQGPAENRNPYKNVMPQKVKADVERTLQKEDEKNDKRLEQVK